jgi:hypothetical protein
VEASFTEVEDSSKSESIKITVGKSFWFKSVESMTWADSRDTINTGTANNSKNFFILNFL